MGGMRTFWVTVHLARLTRLAKLYMRSVLGLSWSLEESDSVLTRARTTPCGVPSPVLSDSSIVIWWTLEDTTQSN